MKEGRWQGTSEGLSEGVMLKVYTSFTLFYRYIHTQLLCTSSGNRSSSSSPVGTVT